MITNILKDKPTRVFIILAGIFVANALIAEIIGVKIFPGSHPRHEPGEHPDLW